MNYVCHCKGGEIFFEIPSVGATINVMMAAVLASGTTTLPLSDTYLDTVIHVDGQPDPPRSPHPYARPPPSAGDPDP